MATALSLLIFFCVKDSYSVEYANHCRSGVRKYCEPHIWMPDYTENELFSYLKARKPQSLETYLVGMVNKQLGQMLLKECNIGKLSRNSADLEDFEIERVVKKLKNLCFTVTGKMPWENAQLTMGGICLSEISQKTMESKKVKGL